VAGRSPKFGPSPAELDCFGRPGPRVWWSGQVVFRIAIQEARARAGGRSPGRGFWVDFTARRRTPSWRRGRSFRAVHGPTERRSRWEDRSSVPCKAHPSGFDSRCSLEGCLGFEYPICEPDVVMRIERERIRFVRCGREPASRRMSRAPAVGGLGRDRRHARVFRPPDPDTWVGGSGWAATRLIAARAGGPTPTSKEAGLTKPRIPGVPVLCRDSTTPPRWWRALAVG